MSSCGPRSQHELAPLPSVTMTSSSVTETWLPEPLLSACRASSLARRAASPRLPARLSCDPQWACRRRHVSPPIAILHRIGRVTDACAPQPPYSRLSALLLPPSRLTLGIQASVPSSPLSCPAWVRGLSLSHRPCAPAFLFSTLRPARSSLEVTLGSHASSPSSSSSPRIFALLLSLESSPLAHRRHCRPCFRPHPLHGRQHS
jgi:hypothetical protein